jgi:hypothetical protein
MPDAARSMPESERPTTDRTPIARQHVDVWATSLRPETPLRQGRGVWAYVRVDDESAQAYLSSSDGWLDVDMTAEACRHAVERAPEGSTLTMHVPLAQRWVVEGLHAPVDKRAADRGISLHWNIYCATQDGRSAPMERARTIVQLGVAAWRLDNGPQRHSTP